MVLVLAVLALSVVVEGSQRFASAQKEASLRMGETRATLDPNMFISANSILEG